MNNYCKALIALLPILCALAISAPRGALAAQEIVLINDQSQTLRLAEAPATVIVGNPMVADVTIEGKTLFLHPRSYGLTNVLLLDSDGQSLGDYAVRVVFRDSDSVSLYTPGGRQTYTCVSDCEPTLRVGDQNAHFSGYGGQTTARNAISSGQAMGEELIARPTVTSIAPGAGPTQ